MEPAHGPLETSFSVPRTAIPHPLGIHAKVLLTSVFGPYAHDDEYGSRVINPMELYHNQVTRVEGPFSLRMFHRSWGLMLIQANIAAPCTLLDFPTLDRFVEEIKSRRYDVVGISSITTNVLKVKRMCELIRQHLPEAVIVVGGHVANIADLETRIDADFIVRGEGVRWFRRYLGEDPNQPHPPPRHAHADRHAQHGNLRQGETHRCCCYPDPIRRLSGRLQLLRNLGHVRRQGKVD